jgi:hypothetical protein
VVPLAIDCPRYGNWFRSHEPPCSHHRGHIDSCSLGHSADYWRQLIDFIEQMAQRGKISAADLNLIYATDSVEEAIAHIRAKAVERYGLKRVAHMRRHFPWLGERGFPSKGPDIC